MPLFRRPKDGAQGIPGLLGKPGKDGRHGKDGRDGKDGLKGEKGDRGERGQKGERGERGLRGDRGLTGRALFGGGATAQELISKILAGENITIVQNSDGSITISSTATGSEFTDEMVDDRVAALIQSGQDIETTYNDVANTLTLSVKPSFRRSMLLMGS